MNILVIDVGTSSVRASVLDSHLATVAEHQQAFLPDSPAPGLVEFDAMRLGAVVLACAHAALDAAAAAGATGVAGVGLSTQRASTVVWDRATGVPVGPALGWQDLRTVGDCLTLQADGIRLAPNQTATKAAWLLDAADPERERDLCIGTVDSWVAWVLTAGSAHVTDASNAAVTGLLDPRQAPWTEPVELTFAPVQGDRSRTGPWDAGVLDRLRIPAAALPAILDTAGVGPAASALPGAPPLCAIVGDQQASMAGQGVVAPGPAKITFGTGGMLDVISGSRTSDNAVRHAGGTFPIVASRRGDEVVWGVEAIMLSAGTNVEWLRDDLGIIDDVTDSDALAASCADTGGVVFVPALLGLGTPRWDYGARGTLLGLTRGSGRAEVVRAVLEGVAHRGADLVEAAESDTGGAIPALRIDGGMSRNATFVQALADATGRVVEVSPAREATTRGAGLLAALALGQLGSWDDVAAVWSPARVVEPATTDGARMADRERWARALDRASGWLPELSGLDF
jgi:glycerol kinase